MKERRKQIASEVEVAVITPEQDKFMQSVYEEFLQDRQIILNDYVDDKLLERAVLQIIKFNKEDQGKSVESRVPIILHVNTLGGDVSSGLSLIDVIQTSKTPVYGVCHKACSMGAYILVSCHKRFAFKNATILYHDGSTFVGNSSSKIKDTVRWMNELETRLDNLVFSSTKITEEEYEKHRRDEWYMFPSEAKELGVIHYIIGEDAELDEIL